MNITPSAFSSCTHTLIFCVLQICSLAYAVAFRHPSFWGYLWSVIYCLVVDWLLIGFAVASTCRYTFQLFYLNLVMLYISYTCKYYTIWTICSHVANKYMRQYHSHSVEQEVEWLYAFDVHANAFFCSFLLTYVVQVKNKVGAYICTLRVVALFVGFDVHLAFDFMKL